MSNFLSRDNGQRREGRKQIQSWKGCHKLDGHAYSRGCRGEEALVEDGVAVGGLEQKGMWQSGTDGSVSTQRQRRY